MLSKVSDWSLLTNPAANDDYVQKKIDTVKDIVSIITDGSHDKSVAPLVSFVLSDIEAESANSKDIFKQILSLMQKHQPSTPSTLTISSPEIKLVSALSLGEVILKEEHGRPTHFSHIASTLFCSAIGFADLTHEHYYIKIVKEILDLANEKLNKISCIDRESKPNPIFNIEKINQNDAPPEIANKFKAELMSVVAYIKGIDIKLKHSQEELEVLWWLYNSFSEVQQKYLKDLRVFSSAICCGCEIGSKVGVSAPLKIRHLVSQAASKDRRATSLSQKTLKEVIGSWDKSTWDMLKQNDQNLKNLIQEHPPLFPLSWICQRLIESHGTADISSEFSVNVGGDMGKKFTPDIIAVQTYNEMMALKVWNNYV